MIGNDWTYALSNKMVVYLVLTIFEMLINLKIYYNEFEMTIKPLYS